MKKAKKKNIYAGIYLDKERGTYTVSTTFTDKSHVRHKIGKRGFTTQAEALEWKNKQYEFYSQNYINVEGETTTELGVLVDQYLKAKSRNCKESTIQVARYYLKAYFLAYFTKERIVNLNVLKPVNINDYYTYLADLEIKESTKNIIISRIIDFIEWLDLMEYITPSIARKFKQIVVKFEQLEPSKNTYLNETEIDKLISVLDPNDRIDNYYRLVLITLIYSGLRKSELYGLTWKDIDFENNTISVNKQYQQNLHKIVNYTKTNLNRVVYVPEWLIEYLEEYRNSLHYHKGDEDEIIFTNHGINQRLPEYCEKAGIKHFKLHDLRHTFCTMLYDNGASGKYVQHQMGHTTEATSKNIYEHLTGKMLDEGIEITNSFKKI